MSSRAQRVNNGINSLVRRLLVEIPGEDPADGEEREENAIHFVTEFLERWILLIFAKSFIR
jgi:gamma-tubulin complex component 3